MLGLPVQPPLIPRIWLCQYFDLFESEIAEIEYYIEEDIGNNSAWNYRYFLLKQRMTEPRLPEELKYVVSIIVSYVFEKIQVKPNNEAAWNYLKGWFQCYEFSSLRSEKASDSTVVEFAIMKFP